MKAKKIILLIFFAILSIGFPIQGHGQATKNNSDSLLVYVVDKKTGESLSRVNLFYLDKSIGATTNKNGLAVLPFKTNGKLITSYLGYESDTLSLRNFKADTLTVEIETRYVFTSADLHASIEQNTAKEAKKDLKRGIVKILHHYTPKKEEAEFAEQYDFKFVFEKDKPRIYRLSYNGIMIYHLVKKNGVSFADSLTALYDRNWGK